MLEIHPPASPHALALSRHSSVSSTASSSSATSSSSFSSSAASYQDDSITLAPPSVPHPAGSVSAPALPPSPRRVESCAGLGGPQCERLWSCMLELQHRYGCYRSARMEAAICLWERGLELDFMPSKGALDLLNDSIDDLPDEGWKMLGQLVAVDGRVGACRSRWTRWKPWARHGR